MCLSAVLNLFAQNDSIQYKLSLANKLLMSNGHEKAYQLFVECAAMNDPKATNAVGIMKQRGWGTDKDENGSIAWFWQSAAMDYKPAFSNLAQIYAKGLGTEQRFDSAFYYTSRLLDFSPKWANFRLGYYYYKGLGVEQNYELAVQHFRAAADSVSANAYYFLGLCYRNGYGVARDEGEAQYYLQKATELGHWYSKEELSGETVETKPTMNRIRGVNGNDNKPGYSFRRIAKQDIKGNAAGVYEGTLVTYDYSGQQIVRTSSLKLTLNAPDLAGKITGEWLEDDSIRADFEAVLTDTALVFENTTYARTDHYNKREAVKWNFTKAVLEKTETDGETFLAGNLQLFSPKTKEPEKPMYLTVKRNVETQNPENMRLSRDFKVFPFPNSSDIQVLFSLEKAENSTLKIFSTTGQQIYSENLGNIPQGKHSYILSFNVPAGLYIVSLQTESGNNSTIITK